MCAGYSVGTVATRKGRVIVRGSEGVLEFSDFSALPVLPVVSVYMATYNHELFISKAIEGVLAQQVEFPIELVIGEDCSKDRTGEIVRRYQRERPDVIRIITGTENVGMIANENRCIAKCRGKYIAFCEGDDFWHHPQKLRMQVAIMERSPDVTLCHTDYDRKVGWITKKSAHRRNATARLAEGEAYIKLLHQWTVKTATAVYCANVLQRFLQSEFNNPDWPFADYNKAIFASVYGRVAFIPLSTATWRRVPGSASRSGYLNSLKIGLAHEACREMFTQRFEVEPEALRSIRRQSKESIRLRAFYAGAAEIFDESHEWLVQNGYATYGFGYKLLRFTLRSPGLLRIARALETAGAMDAIKEICRLARTWAKRTGLMRPGG